MIKIVSKAILETPNASDYKILVARRAILALRDNVTNDMIIKGNQCEGDASEIFNTMLNVALEYPGI